MILQLVLLFLLIFLIFKLHARDQDLPPGEWGLPVVGVLPFVGKNLRIYFQKIKHKYPGIFCLKFGSRIVVFVRNFEMIKKHLNRTDLALRPDAFTYSIFNFFQNIGLIVSNGTVWENNRRFALRHLKDFGFGKSSKMQRIIHREAEAIVQSLGKKTGEAVEVEDSLNVAVVNVIWQLVAGQRLDATDTKVLNFAKAVTHDFTEITGPISLLDYFPVLIKILPNFIKNGWMKVDKLINNRKKSKAFLEEVVEAHRMTLDRSHPRDFIDAYLIEMEEKKEMSITFSDPILNLVSCIHDMFNAGMDTTATTMKWFILYMAAYPHVQERVQEELDSALPRGQLPLLDDKERFPYLQATVYELMRHCTLVPFAVYHSSDVEIQMESYRIPKDSIIVTCVEDCHQDPKYWEKPEEFNPERFLDENGQFKMKTESFIPFGYGKRLCLGESVARMESFMFAGAIAHSYKITLPKGVEVNLEPDDSTTTVNYPKPFKVIFEKRG